MIEAVPHFIRNGHVGPVDGHGRAPRGSSRQVDARQPEYGHLIAERALSIVHVAHHVPPFIVDFAVCRLIPWQVDAGSRPRRVCLAAGRGRPAAPAAGDDEEQRQQENDNGVR